MLHLPSTGASRNPDLKMPKYPFNLRTLPHAVTIKLTFFSWCTSHGAVSHAVAVFFLSSLSSPSRVYLVAQERQDGVSNWLCVQVMLPNFEHCSIIRAKKSGRSPPRERKKRKKNKQTKRQSSQKNNNCCTIIQTSYNFTTWFGMLFHVTFIHLSPSSVSRF